MGFELNNKCHRLGNYKITGPSPRVSCIVIGVNRGPHFPHLQIVWAGTLIGFLR